LRWEYHVRVRGNTVVSSRFKIRCPVPSGFLASAALALCLQRTVAKAEDSIDYKYENYREDDGRITVQTETSSVDQDVLPFDGHIHLTGTIDAVSGATPTGRPAQAGTDQVILTEIHTRRKAWSGDYSEQIKNFNIDAGFAESRESDYVSYGWSVNTLTDFNEKNTTVRAGIAGTDDRVEVFFEPAYLPKHTHSAILGVTQLLDPLTFVTFNVTLGRDTGYLSEPHKFVEKGIEIFPGIVLEEAFGENSPNARNTGTLYASVNRAVPNLKGAVEASYRFYADSYGITSSTVGLAWLQHFGPHVIVTPSARYYEQSAARFYIYNLDDSPVIPTKLPFGQGPYYTSDFRLSAQEDFTYGLKVTWKPKDWFQIDAAYDHLAMRGTDGLTPQSAYPTAGITTLGVKFLW
jgi:hypothetical protein